MPPTLLIDAHNHQLMGAALPNDLDVVVFESPERLLRKGERVSAADVEATAAFLSFELMFSGHVKEFLALAQQSGTLNWVHTAATGLDNPLFGNLARAGVRISNSHAQAPAIAETVVASVLALYQRIPERITLQAQQEWKRITFRELAGSHWLMVGFGAIGRGIAERARPFGCQITAMRRSQTADPLADRTVPLEAIAEEIETADVVVAATPLSAATRNLFDAALFERMRPGATFVNVARGAVADEAALIQGLQSGRPAQAVLDVFATEPLPIDSPLWTMPNVLITPHASNAGDQVADRRAQVFIDNLSAWLADGSLLTEVPPADIPGS